MSVKADALIGLFFEVTLQPGHAEHYFSFVERLKPELANYGRFQGPLSLWTQG